MKPISNIKIIELLSGREKIYLLISYIALVALFSIPMIYFDAAEAMYRLSRIYENQQLDDLILTLVVSIFILSIYLIFISIYLGKKLILIKTEKLSLKRSINQTRHLVAMGKVLGGVSHSVNNHLLPVIALTEEVLEGLDPASEMAKDLGVVLDAAIGAALIIKQLKNFSRQEQVVRETCDLGVALEQAIHFGEKIIPSSIIFNTNIEPTNVRVALSEVSLEIVILNLISNAIDAIGGAQGTISVSLTLTGIPIDSSDALKTYSTLASLRIKDSGTGISKDQISYIFDPFYTTKPAGKGSGLGLSETYGIIKAGGGYINVESTKGVGSIFEIQLPVLLNEDRQGISRFTPL